MNKILIIGLGSIGRKHLEILREIGKVEVAALRTKKGEQIVQSDVTEFFDFEDAISFNPDGVIISNPTSLHVQSALPFLKLGCYVLIEKPVAYSSAEAYQLLNYSDQIRVSYCLRFLEIYEKLHTIFTKEIPFKVSFKRSYYLPKWHPYADYRKEYTAQKVLGGGVIRTLSHEIDLAIHWFGQPKTTVGVVDKLSFLDIDTDDYAYFTFKTDDNVRVSFELDFYSPINVNIGEAFTPKGKYTWSMDSIKFCSYEDTIEETLYATQDNHIHEMYKRQMIDFLGFINFQKSKNATLKDSIEVLKLIEKVEKR